MLKDNVVGSALTKDQTSGDFVLLADTSLVRKPDFYLVAVDRLLARDCVQTRGEVFLKSSIAPSTCA
jgi:hypothetical protein